MTEEQSNKLFEWVIIVGAIAVTGLLAYRIGLTFDQWLYPTVLGGILGVLVRIMYALEKLVKYYVPEEESEQTESRLEHP